MCFFKSYNQFLLAAALIAAGLDGIIQKRHPGPRYDNNSYVDPLPLDQVKQLPTNLLDALRCLKANTVLTQSLGERLITAYLKLKHQQWNEYSSYITPWELENTLDC